MLYDKATTLRDGLLPKLSGSATDVLRGDGTYGAAPSSITEFLFTGDPDTGLSNPSANVIQIITGGAEAWRVLSTGELRGPDAATSSSAGTSRTIRGGPGGSSSGNGGAVNIVGGTPVSGQGGSISLTGADGVGSDKGGGSTNLIGGSATGSGTGGQASFTGGNASTGTAGLVQLIGGTANGAAGNGGALNLQGGPSTGGNNAGNGGNASITGGGTDSNSSSFHGGSITLIPGGQNFATGPGATLGNIDLYNARTSSVSAALSLRLNGTTSHLSHMGSAPTITAGGGTSPSIVGRDETFIVTIGTGGIATSFEVTFANAFTNAPAAVATSDTDIVAMKAVPLTTKVTVSATAPFTAGSKVSVICRGYE